MQSSVSQVPLLTISKSRISPPNMKLACGLIGDLVAQLLPNNAEAINIVEEHNTGKSDTENKILCGLRSFQGQGQGQGQGNGKPFEAFLSQVPAKVFAKFKERNILRPQVHEVTGKSFKMNDEAVSFADQCLVPVEGIFAPVPSTVTMVTSM